jgi:mannose-1-phosphate guanylyltransferase/phosphomannomutase
MKAVILAGGAGTRMRPLTYVVPKSLLPIGGKPLIERTIQYLNSYGVNEFVMCVAYLKKQIMEALGTGSELGVKIHYAQADVPLGTGGQLKTAEEFIDGTFLALNGDIVTSLNVRNLINAHEENEAIGTIALKKFEVKIPYGYVTTGKDSTIEKFDEKPTLVFLANAGVYCFERSIFNYIKDGVACSLETETFPKLISSGERLTSYYEEAYWADVGSMVDFERVNDELLKDPRLQVNSSQ